jgi:tetratricopeptide (TPR) repeat protein
MRRADGDVPAVGRAGGSLRRAAVVMALGLAAMAPAGPAAVSGPPDDPFRGGDPAAVAGFYIDLLAGLRTGGYYVYVLYGSYLDEQKEYDQAIAAYDQAIRIDPRNADAFGGRALVWSEKNELDKAIADLTEAIRLEPEYPDSYVSRGWAWQTKGQLDQAIADFSEAIRRDPGDRVALVYRAGVWMSKKAYDKAVDD